MNEPSSSLPTPWFTNMPGIVLTQEGYNTVVVGNEAYLANQCGVTLEEYNTYLSQSIVLLPKNIPPPPYTGSLSGSI